MIKLTSVDQFEKDLNKFLEAKHKGIEEHTKGLEKAMADKAAGEAAADAAIKAEDPKAYRQAQEACANAEFYIKFHTQKLEQLNAADIEQPKYEDVRRMLVEDISKRDEVELRKIYEWIDGIVALGQETSNHVIRCRELMAAYCNEVVCLKGSVKQSAESSINSLFSKSVGAAVAVSNLPGYREYKGLRGITPSIDVMKKKTNY